MVALEQSLEYIPVELSFGTSGLRGLVTDMTDLECYINTAGFMRFLQEQQDIPKGSKVYVAGDLRHSTPRILKAVIKAITDRGDRAEYCGLVPTPTVAYCALQNDAPSIMVTGSHIPADRNGIKFYKLGGEILKGDEDDIKRAVAEERRAILNADFTSQRFDAHGMLPADVELPDVNEHTLRMYIERYTTVFHNAPLVGKQVVVYQHSAVGRDMMVDLMQALGAEVLPVGRSDVFVSIDTENVTPDDQAYFTSLAHEYPDAFAIISTDGDSDRPFVIDENGLFHRGDELGAVVAKWLDADFVAIPISSNDAVDQYLTNNDMPYVHTRIGSPYVIAAMNEAVTGGKSRVVGWEVNGGFLLANDFEVHDKILSALPTRDAMLPIVVALIAASEQSKSISDLFSQLPSRFTQAGLIDEFPVETSRAIVARFSSDTADNYEALEQYFSGDKGFGRVSRINSVDGVRIYFDNGDIAHLRPSGNAPQLRIYSVANSQERADEIVQLAIQEPNGLLRQIGQSAAAIR